MRRRLGILTLVTTATSVLVALSIPAAAGAALPATCTPTYAAGCVYDSGLYDTSIQDFARARDGSYVGAAGELQYNVGTLAKDAAAAEAVRQGLWRARVAAKLLPGLNTVMLSAAAFSLGWKIGRTIDTKYLHWSGPASMGTTASQSVGTVSAAAVRWDYRPASSSGAITTLYPSCGTQACWVLQVSVGGGTAAGLWTGVYNDTTNAIKAAMSAVSLGVTLDLASATDTSCAAVTSNPRCLLHVVTDSEFMGGLKLDTFRDWQTGDPVTQTTTGFDPSYTAGGFATQAAQTAAFEAGTRAEPTTFATNAAEQAVEGSVPDQTGSSITVPDCTGMTWPDCSAQLQALGLSGAEVVLDLDGADVTKPAGSVVTQSPAASTGVSPGAVVTVNVNPDPLPLELPAPNPNETYTDYVARLQALGYVGTVTEVAEPAVVDGYGPDAPTRITYTKPGTTTVKTLDPLTFPVPAPRIWPDTAVTIRVNPSTATPVPTDSGGGGGIDFTPLQNIPQVCNFPFGVLCWVKDAVSAMEATPVAPEIDWQMPAINTSVYSNPMGDHYTVGLSWLDDYMGTIRTIESWLLWIGAVWYVGSRLIGLKGGGDPSDAVDEAYNGLVD